LEFAQGPFFPRCRKGRKSFEKPWQKAATRFTAAPVPGALDNRAIMKFDSLESTKHFTGEDYERSYVPCEARAVPRTARRVIATLRHQRTHYLVSIQKWQISRKIQAGG
jgi:hypothetical protein